MQHISFFVYSGCKIIHQFSKQMRKKSTLDKTAKDILNKSEQIETLKKEYLHGRKWAEIETMDVYLHKAFKIASKYIASVKPSPQEEEQFRVLKDWHRNGYIPQKSNLLPFIKLEAIGKTSQTDGEEYLTKREVDFYLENGVVGPISIKSISKDNLFSVLEKFKNFHKEYNRNLGSVYTMLKTNCLFDLATNKEILSKVSSILGPNLMLCNFTINELAPGMGKSTIETGGMVHALNCHSDLASGAQYHFETKTNHIKNLTLDNQCVNVWLSISGTNSFNAPLYFFPKTHHWEITTPFTHIDKARNNPEALDHVLRLLSFNHGSAPRRIGLYNEEFKDLWSSKYRFLLPKIQRTEIYTQPGDCIFFNAHTRHGSGFNNSSKLRLAITMRFNTAMTEAGGQENAGSVVTQIEREELGIVADKRKPMIQVLGQNHHPNNLPINIFALRKN